MDQVVAALRAAGCVWAEEEAEILRRAAVERALADPDATDRDAELRVLLARRVAGEPLEHVVGWAGFLDLRLSVAPGVFIPRRRTELLALLALAELAAARPGTAPPGPARSAPDHAAPVFVELCAGVAPVASAVAGKAPDVIVHAADLDSRAVACATTNLPTGTVHRGDLFAALPSSLRGRVRVLAASPPYVPHDELHLLPVETRLHEPPSTVDGGADGLALATRIGAEAPQWLAPRGVLLLEVADHQAGDLAARLRGHGFATEVVRDDEREATVVRGALR